MGTKTPPRFAFDVPRFRAARDTLHAAAVLLGSVADSLSPPRPDDSQSNLGLSDEGRGFETRTLPGVDAERLQLSIRDLELCLPVAGAPSFRLSGRTIGDALRWAEERAVLAPASLVRRDYPDMPPNGALDGAPFPDADMEALDEVFRWYEMADAALETLRVADPALGEARIWPHHFDFGALLALDPPARVIGLGMSPGDTTSPDPYFYCTPYPQPDPTLDLPRLRDGTWLRGTQTLAWLPAKTLAATRHPRDVVASYLESAVGACRTLLG